jgi:hypothetical protein
MADYADITEVKQQIEKNTTGADLYLPTIITAASRAIDRTCGRPDSFFVADAAASARVYVGSGLSYQSIDDCVEIASVSVKDSITDTTYTAWTSPSTAYAGDGDWYPGRGSVRRPRLNQLPYNLLFVDINGDYAIFTAGRYRQSRGFYGDAFGPARLGRAPGVMATVEVSAKWGWSVVVPAQIKEACIMQVARWYKRLEGSMSDSLASVDLGQMLYVQEVDPDVRGILYGGRFILPSDLAYG